MYDNYMIGKGTSARDGAAVAGALLMALDRRAVYGVFATHIHEMLDMPFFSSLSNVACKRMSYQADDDRKSLCSMYYVLFIYFMPI